MGDKHIDGAVFWGNIKAHEDANPGDFFGIHAPDAAPIGTVVGSIRGTPAGDKYVYDPALNHPDVTSWWIKAPIEATPDDLREWRWVPITPGRFTVVDNGA